MSNSKTSTDVHSRFTNTLPPQRRGPILRSHREHNYLQNSLVTWNVNEACNWLTHLGIAFSKYQTAFREHGVDGLYLNILAEDDIKDLISSRIHQKRVWQQLLDLRGNQQFSNDIQIFERKEFIETDSCAMMSEDRPFDVFVGLDGDKYTISFKHGSHSHLLLPSYKSRVSHFIVRTEPHGLNFHFNTKSKTQTVFSGHSARFEISISCSDLSSDEDYTFCVRAVDGNGYKSQYSLSSNPITTMPAPEINFGELTVGCVIGSGTYGDVFAGTCNGMDVAIKSLRHRKEALEAFEKEVCIWGDIKHPTMLPLWYQCKNPDLIMITPLCEKGSLSDILRKRKMSWFEKIDVAEQVAIGMQYLHQIKIYHRDLKGSNILLTRNNRIRISDFGLSKSSDMTDGSINTRLVGTIAYMAPEVLSKTKFDYPADVYSYGMVLYELAAGKMPFHGLSLQKIVAKLIVYQQRPKLPDNIPFGYVVLIQLCWRQEPEYRPTFDKIMQYIRYQQDQQYPYKHFPDSKDNPLNDLFKNLIERTTSKFGSDTSDTSDPSFDGEGYVIT